MAAAFLHFVAGTTGSLLVFLAFARLAGIRSFSAPFGMVFIGVICASLAHFVSPWATPAVIAVYGVFSGLDAWRERKASRVAGSRDVV